VKRRALIVIVTGLWLAAFASTGAQRRGGASLAEYLPPGQGRDLVAKNCTVCHDLKGVLQLRKPKAGWEAIVLDMGARGAPISLDDIDPIVAYLADVFGEKAPPLVDVNADPQERLVMVPGVTPQGADRLIAERAKGPLASHDQVRAALGMETAPFEKVKYYLFVKPPETGGR
jgi:DNA uptake protein ComE-like DNA-binding protein